MKFSKHQVVHIQAYHGWVRLRLAYHLYSVYDTNDKLLKQFEVTSVLKLIRIYPTITFVVSDKDDPIYIELEPQDYDKFDEILDRESFEVCICYIFIIFRCLSLAKSRT